MIEWLLAKTYMARARFRRVPKIHRTTDSNRLAYYAVGRSEIDDYFSARKVWGIEDGKIRQIELWRTRHSMLEPVNWEIDWLLSSLNRPVSVLEAGCGNGMNLHLLSEQWGNSVTLAGSDLVRDRLSLGKAVLGLENVDLSVWDFEERCPWPHKFDLVFTVAALEQVPHLAPDIVRRLALLARHSLVMVEPSDGLAIHAAQRRYQSRQDIYTQARVDAEKLGLNPTVKPIRLIGNPLNPFASVVCHKQGKEERVAEGCPSATWSS